MSEVQLPRVPRFVSKLGDDYPVDRDGFLLDPESKYESKLCANVVPSDSLLAYPILVILGEPGAGKSTLLSALLERERGSSADDRTFLYFNLNAYSSDAFLYKAVFERPDFLQWLRTEQQGLTVYFDALDECIVRVDSMVNLLSSEFEKIAHRDVFIRVACRPSYWNSSIDAAIGRVRHEGTVVQTFTILPLRRVDALAMATSCGVDELKFFEQVTKNEIGPFAARPLTLKALVQIFKRDGGALPTSKNQIFQKCCEIMSSDLRTTPGTSGRLSSRQRMDISARTAAVLLLSGNESVDLADSSSSALGVLSVGRLVQSDVGQDTLNTSCSKQNVIEAIDTPIFSASSDNSVVISHRSYAEYLAAYYLHKVGISVPQLTSMLLQVHDGRLQVVPQLQEIAAWLAVFDKEFLAVLVENDPWVLLRSDVSGTEELEKKSVVESLLVKFDAGDIIDKDWDLRKSYWKLGFKELGACVRSYISDRSKGVVLRRFVIDLVEACHSIDVVPELLQVVNDHADDQQIREQAAHAILEIGNESDKLILKPYLFGIGGPDPEDSIKGNALIALWPGHITTQELAKAMTWPKRSNLFGSYKMFVTQELPNAVTRESLIPLLAWIRNTNHAFDSLSPFKQFVRRCLIVAMDHIDDPAVAEEVGAIVFRMIGEYYGGSVFKADQAEPRSGSRMKVIRATSKYYVEANKRAYAHEFVHCGLVSVDDFYACIDEALAAGDACAGKFWSEIALGLWDWRNWEHTDFVLEKALVRSDAIELLVQQLRPIELGSDEAAVLKKRHAEYSEHSAPKKRQARQNTPAKTFEERIENLLALFSEGDVTAWWRLNLVLLTDEDKNKRDVFETRLSASPGWMRLSTSAKERIVGQAKEYLFKGDPQKGKWIGKDTIYHPATAGYRALRLLMEVEPTYFDSLPKKVWDMWACIVVGFPFITGEKAGALHCALVKMAFSVSENEAISTVDLLVRAESKKSSHLPTLCAVTKYIESRALSDAMLALAGKRGQKPEVIGNILEEIVTLEAVSAQEYAFSLLEGRKWSLPRTRQLAKVAAVALLRRIPSEAWDRVWAILQSRNDLSKDVFEEIANGIDERHGGGLLSALSIRQLGSLFAALVRLFPYEEDVEHDGAHMVGREESARHLRDAVIRVIKDSGKSDAAEVVAGLQREFPELAWLAAIRFDARESYLRHSWCPISPEELFQLAKDSKRRFISNGNNLLDAVMECLYAYNIVLQGETPLAFTLWDEVSKKCFKPKNEAALADALCVYLRQQLKERHIIINREVEIRRGSGGEPGERTDIHIDAVSNLPNGDLISVIVEVKGEWNGGIREAMKTQLVDRYLKDNLCRHGIYLVGYYRCPQWSDSKDYRRKSLLSMSKMEISDELVAQARSLSLGSTSVRGCLIDASLR